MVVDASTANDKMSEGYIIAGNTSGDHALDLTCRDYGYNYNSMLVSCPSTFTVNTIVLRENGDNGEYAYISEIKAFREFLLSDPNAHSNSITRATSPIYNANLEGSRVGWGQL